MPQLLARYLLSALLLLLLHNAFGVHLFGTNVSVVIRSLFFFLVRVLVSIVDSTESAGVDEASYVPIQSYVIDFAMGIHG